MRRLSHVAFAHPIPIPGTHVRQADFAALDGWSIEDDDARITLSRATTRFYTYVSASCVEMQEMASATGQSPGNQSGPAGLTPAVATIPTGKRKR